MDRILQRNFHHLTVFIEGLTHESGIFVLFVKRAPLRWSDNDYLINHVFQSAIRAGLLIIVYVNSILLKLFLIFFQLAFVSVPIRAARLRHGHDYHRTNLQNRRLCDTQLQCHNTNGVFM
jgi:hypothetical protein